MIRISDLRKNYGKKQVLKGMSFEIPSGVSMGLLEKMVLVKPPFFMPF